MLPLQHQGDSVGIWTSCVSFGSVGLAVIDDIHSLPSHKYLMENIWSLLDELKIRYDWFMQIVDPTFCSSFLFGFYRLNTKNSILDMRWTLK